VGAQQRGPRTWEEARARIALRKGQSARFFVHATVTCWHLSDWTSTSASLRRVLVEAKRYRCITLSSHHRLVQPSPCMQAKHRRDSIIQAGTYAQRTINTFLLLYVVFSTCFTCVHCWEGMRFR
jgi:hypothetical protein